MGLADKLEQAARDLPIWGGERHPWYDHENADLRDLLEQAANRLRELEFYIPEGSKVGYVQLNKR